MHTKSFIIIFLMYSIHAEETWTGKWFPHNPNDTPEEPVKNTTSSEKWTGKWFPSNPQNTNDENSKTSTTTTTPKSTSWTGKWFPSNPKESSDKQYVDTSSKKSDEKPDKGNWFRLNSENSQDKAANIASDLSSTPTRSDNKEYKGNWFPENPVKTDYKESTYEHDRIMGIPNSDCDDGEVNLHRDFDPSNTDHTKMYTCLETSSYKPKSSLEPIETIHEVPKFYTPVHKCMNETITYDQGIPTLGCHRPLWPTYGEYKFVPPQRWLHSLEHGAIVMLYDPCALSSEVDKLRNIVKSCLYRHIITPYKLSRDRPLALVAWATSLEMSIYDKTTAVEFIKKYAKTGPEKTSRQGQYKKMLIEESKIVSDSDDSEICGNISSMM
ncbi:uncharacterized protein [Chironomus tepperi]|uniref:uncharacterized protein n=1 Tax=Chironomus tepperi TaxID=113505 RepID=UPI00391F2F09